jgi:uncharacterized membrane protein YeiH
MEGMDLLGCNVIGFITALGGGTLRDMLLGRTPPIWFVDYDELLLVIVVATLTFYCWPAVSQRLHLTDKDEWLFWTDTLGLGVFAARGAIVGVDHPKGPIHLVGCALCGLLTATFGGVTRDVLIGKPPRILYSSAEIYATAAFAGALVSALVARLNAELQAEAVLLGFSLTVLVRVLAYNDPMRLPVFPAKAIYSPEERLQSRWSAAHLRPSQRGLHSPFVGEESSRFVGLAHEDARAII